MSPAHLQLALLTITCGSLMVTIALVQVVLMLLRALAASRCRIEGLQAALLTERTSLTPFAVNGGRQ